MADGGGLAKRLFDTLASAAGLVVLSPLLLFCGCLIRMETRGPAIFRQTRVGLNGGHFEIMKLRTMCQQSAGIGLSITTDHDARITKVGRVLRKFKLDELPQLLNVLKGEMSLVGPRPEVPKFVEDWAETDRKIVLSVRPGITDPASLKFRNESEQLSCQDDPEAYYRSIIVPQKLALYKDYVRRQSLAADVWIILQTLVAIIR